MMGLTEHVQVIVDFYQHIAHIPVQIIKLQGHAGLFQAMQPMQVFLQQLVKPEKRRKVRIIKNPQVLQYLFKLLLGNYPETTFHDLRSQFIDPGLYRTFLLFGIGIPVDNFSIETLAATAYGVAEGSGGADADAGSTNWFHVSILMQAAATAEPVRYTDLPSPFIKKSCRSC